MRRYKDVHLLSIEIQKYLSKNIYNYLDKTDIEIINKITLYTKGLTRYKSDYVERVSNLILNAYRKQGILDNSFKMGWINDQNILDRFDGMITQLPEQVLKNVKLINKEVTRLLVDGDITKQQAINAVKNTIGEFSFFSRDGRRWKMNTLVSRMIRDECKRATNETSESIAKELGTNIYQVSKHAGARPKCADDQGKLFSDSGGTFVDLNGKRHIVLPWSQSSKGEPDGLFGYNCRHIKYPMVKGFTVPSSIDPMKQIANELNKQTLVHKS